MPAAVFCSHTARPPRTVAGLRALLRVRRILTVAVGAALSSAATRRPVPVGRWLRRLGLVIFGLLLAITLAAVGFDLATTGDSRSATTLYKGPFVRVGKTLVAYRQWGTSGTPIVLLGGAAEPSWVWHDVGPRLAAGHHVVYAIDLPPFGYTERQGPYTLAGWVTLVRGFEQRLGIRRPPIVGHSLGAGVAAGTALADPAVSPIVPWTACASVRRDAASSRTSVYPYYLAHRLLTGSDWPLSKAPEMLSSDPPHFGHDVLAN